MSVDTVIKVAAIVGFVAFLAVLAVFVPEWNLVLVLVTAAAMAIYDPSTRRLAYACAGHPPPLLKHAGPGGAVERLDVPLARRAAERTSPGAHVEPEVCGGNHAPRAVQREILDRRDGLLDAMAE